MLQTIVQGQERAAADYSRRADNGSARQVPTELGGLHEAINKLSGCLAQLRERVGPITLNQPKCDGPAPDPRNGPNFPVCEIAHSIRSAREHVDMLAMELLELTGRIEV